MRGQQASILPAPKLITTSVSIAATSSAKWSRSTIRHGAATRRAMISEVMPGIGLARRVDGQQHHFVGMRQRLGELRMEVARTGVAVRLEQRRDPPPGEHLPHGGERRGQLARMMGVVVHIDLLRGVHIELETPFHPENEASAAQLIGIQRSSSGLRGAPHRTTAATAFSMLTHPGTPSVHPLERARGCHQVVGR